MTIEEAKALELLKVARDLYVASVSNVSLAPTNDDFRISMMKLFTECCTEVHAQFDQFKSRA